MDFLILTTSKQTIIQIFRLLILLSVLTLTRTNSACPSGSTYVSLTDASTYASTICAAVTANTNYRIQGGASLYCTSGSPVVSSNDINLRTQALCIATTTVSGGSSSSTSDVPVKRTIPPGCPTNYVQATYAQALQYRSLICQQLGQWDIVALQGQGSIRGYGYGSGCPVTENESASMGDIACVPSLYFAPITTTTITIVNAGEDVCSTCQTLATTTEASTYYTSIAVGDVARLAGGSSVQRTSTSTFLILNNDATIRTNKICAPLPRGGCASTFYLTTSCTCAGTFHVIFFSVIFSMYFSLLNL